MIIQVIRTIAFNHTEKRLVAGDVLVVKNQSPRGVWVEFEGDDIFLTNIAPPHDYEVIAQ